MLHGAGILYQHLPEQNHKVLKVNIPAPWFAYSEYVPMIPSGNQHVSWEYSTIFMAIFDSILYVYQKVKYFLKPYGMVFTIFCFSWLINTHIYIYIQYYTVGIAIVNHPPFIIIAMGGMNHQKWVVYDIAIPTLHMNIKTITDICSKITEFCR